MEPRDFNRNYTPDLRRNRADAMTNMIMRVIDRYVRPEDQPYAADELRKALYDAGIEVVTDDMRKEIGRPPRDEKGWIEEELHALEKRRLEVMMQPLKNVRLG